MSSILDKAIQSVLASKAAWCRFITGNDVGTTGKVLKGFIETVRNKQEHMPKHYLMA